MEIYSPTLFIEINNDEFIFMVGDENNKEDFIVIHKSIVPIKGIENCRITNFNLVSNIIKENLYLIEQELNFTFKDTVLIINNFRCTFANLTGFKKLNGSQILKENITYILNSLKSCIDEFEENKKILHIFNSKYNLDRKKIENLPIGLFGDFYFHELSFCLINNSDYKNLNNIFDKNNLKIKKIFLKSFAEGSYISEEYTDVDTFFKIEINENHSNIFYFENDSLKFEENFNFGSDIIIRDMSKITSLETNTIKKIISSTNLTKDIQQDELVEKHFFENQNYIKIKKKLLFEIAEARIQELLDVFIAKNINLQNFNMGSKIIFLTISNESHFKCFKNLFKSFEFRNKNLPIRFMENISTKDLINNVNKLVHFGWKKEAIPITHSKKSTIAKFFDVFFN